MFKLKYFTHDEMKLNIFVHSLSTEAQNWLVTHPAGTFDTWEKLSSAFLGRFYSEWKTYGVRCMIVNINQNQVKVLLRLIEGTTLYCVFVLIINLLQG